MTRITITRDPATTEEAEELVNALEDAANNNRRGLVVCDVREPQARARAFQPEAELHVLCTEDGRDDPILEELAILLATGRPPKVQ